MIVNRVENSNHQIKKVDMCIFHLHLPVSILSKQNLTHVFDFHYKVKDSAKKKKLTKFSILLINVIINSYKFFFRLFFLILSRKKKRMKKLQD